MSTWLAALRAQERVENEVKTLLNFLIWLLDHLAGGIANKTDGKRKDEFSSLRFIKQTRSHASPYGMEFQL